MQREVAVHPTKLSLGKVAVKTSSKRQSRFHLRPPSKRDVGCLLLGGALVGAAWGVATWVTESRTPLAPQSAHIDSPWIPSTVKRWEIPIDAAAKKYNIDPTFLAIIMTMESGGDPKADSGYANGLMQITPGTAKEIAAKHLKQPTSHYNVKDPQTNIEFGAAYLAYLRDNYGSWRQGPSWDNSVELIAAGYNGGPLASIHLGGGKGLHDPQTVVYSRDAFNMWRERHQADSLTFDRWKDRGGSRLLDAAKKDQ